MEKEYFDLATGDINAFIRDRLPNAALKNEELELSFQFSRGPAAVQLNRLKLALRATGGRVKSIGLLMMGAVGQENVHEETIRLVDSSCPNLKKFYAAALSISNEKFDEQTLKPFFGWRNSLFKGRFGGVNVNTFADCKVLKRWFQDVSYVFNGKCLNFVFPALQSINFSKVAGIDNEHLEPFLSKNPHLKSMTLTRCTIDAKVLELIAKHVPAVESLAFNFRRSLVQQSDMQKNLKNLLQLEHLTALNLDCVGNAMGDILLKMAEKGIPLKRVGLFCCPWDEKITKAFGNLKDLKSLHLANITDLGNCCLGPLSRSLVGLSDLTLKSIPTITIDAVLTLMANCQRLTTATLVLAGMTHISTGQYNLLVDAIKKRPEKIKLTISLCGSKIPLRLPVDLLKRNLELLEIHCVDDRLNKNVDFDFHCASSDGGYDVVQYSPEDVLQGGVPGCPIN